MCCSKKTNYNGCLICMLPAANLLVKVFTSSHTTMAMLSLSLYVGKSTEYLSFDGITYWAGTEALCLFRSTISSVFTYSIVASTCRIKHASRLSVAQMGKIATLMTVSKSALELHDTLQTVQAAIGKLFTLHGDEQGDACIEEI